MYLGGGGIEVDLPVAYQQLIAQIFLTAAGLARAGAFQRVGDTVELDAQGQNVKNIAAGGFDLVLSPAGADGFLRDAVVAAALLAPDSIAACLHAVVVRIGGDLQAQPRVDQTDGGEHPVIALEHRTDLAALELEHIVRTGQDRQQCEGGRGRKPFVVAGQAAEAFVNIQNPAQDCAVQLSVVCKQRFFRFIRPPYPPRALVRCCIEPGSAAARGDLVSVFLSYSDYYKRPCVFSDFFILF